MNTNRFSRLFICINENLFCNRFRERSDRRTGAEKLWKESTSLLHSLTNVQTIVLIPRFCKVIKKWMYSTFRILQEFLLCSYLPGKCVTVTLICRGFLDSWLLESLLTSDYLHSSLVNHALESNESGWCGFKCGTSLSDFRSSISSDGHHFLQICSSLTLQLNACRLSLCGDGSLSDPKALWEKEKHILMSENDFSTKPNWTSSPPDVKCLNNLVWLMY